MAKPFDHSWTGQRLPESPYDRTPTRATLGWMQQLPPRVVPLELARQFARITNRLARVWDTPAQCREYLENLLLDRRGKRRGFPPEAIDELRTLADYYWKLHPQTTHDVWDEVRERAAPARRARS